VWSARCSPYFDAKHGGGRDCCVAIDWPAGSKRIVVIPSVVNGASNTYRLVYVDPATGAAAPGVVLAAGEMTLYPLDFDASGRYALFGLQDTHTVSTWWWSGGGKPVRVRQIELGDQVPAEVAGAYVGGDW
jgi:hypothetical protein